MDMSEGERESFLLMDVLEDVVGGFCENCAGLNFEIKLNPVRLSHKWVALVTIVTSIFQPSVILWRVGQVECLSNDSGCYAFENTF